MAKYWTNNPPGHTVYESDTYYPPPLNGTVQNESNSEYFLHWQN